MVQNAQILRTLEGSFREDSWLSAQLGLSVAEWKPESPRQNYSTSQEQWDFLYARVAPKETSLLHSLEQAQFKLVDTQIQWTTLLDRDAKMGNPFFFQESADSEFEITSLDRADSQSANAVRELARRAFSLSRFHTDPLISVEQANRIKAEWAYHFFLGQRGDAMIGAKRRGSSEYVGFLQLLTKSQTLTVDLIAVDSSMRGKGIAQAMLAFAATLFPHLTECRVGTQLANGPSIQLYQKMGFKLTGAQHVLHWHSKQTDH